MYYVYNKYILLLLQLDILQESARIRLEISAVKRQFVDILGGLAAVSQTDRDAVRTTSTSSRRRQHLSSQDASSTCSSSPEPKRAGDVIGHLLKEVIIQLMKTKCLPVLYYNGLEACPLNKSQIKALDYVLLSSFSKIFCTKSKDVVDECMPLFRCSSVLSVANKRKAKFLDDYLKSYNNLCK